MSEQVELVRAIRVVQVMDCLADPSKIRVMAEPSCDLRETLPHLAALLPRAGYNHTAGILTLVHEGRMLTIYPQMITLAKALNEDDARAVLEWLRGLINEAYARREDIEPCFTRRRSPRLLDAYLLLPRSNCKRCGEATCMALAAPRRPFCAWQVRPPKAAERPLQYPPQPRPSVGARNVCHLLRRTFRD